MKCTCLCALSVLVIALHRAQCASLQSSVRVKHTVTPIQKVIELLTGLTSKIEGEGKAEAKTYDDFACFCKEQADSKLYHIETSRKKIGKLNATIDELNEIHATLAAEISQCERDIYWNEVNLEDEQLLRETQHEQYVKKAKNVSNALASVHGAIRALKDAKGSMMGDSKLDLAQVHTLAGSALNALQKWNMSEKMNASRAMLALSELKKPGHPHGYKFQSNAIMAILLSLEDVFFETKKDVDRIEFQSVDAFEKKQLELEWHLKLHRREKAEQEEEHDEVGERLKKAEGDRTQETNDMNADQSFLDELTTDCQTKATLWDQRSKARAGELSALSKATDMLKEKGAPAYNTNKKLVDLQTLQATSFLQVRDQNTVAMQMLAAQKALNALRRAAHTLHSPALFTIAMRMKLSADHFVKVRALIKDLITRLQADAQSEADQKSFCDREMEKAVTSRDKASAGIEDSDAKISKLKAEEGALDQEVVDLSQSISEDRKALQEVLELRTKDKWQNMQTISTAKEGKEAVDFALSVLKEFYEGAAAALLQYVPPNADRDGNTVGDLAPETFDDEYRGSQEESKGILGILEVIKSDFERSISTTEDEEKTAHEEYNAFEIQTMNNIKEKDAAVKTKTGRISEIKDDLIELTDSLSEFEALKENAMTELDKLDDICVKSAESYKVRMVLRKREVAALKEAQAALESWQE